MESQSFELLNVPITSAFTPGVELLLGGMFNVANIEIVNGGAKALADLKLQKKDHANGEWVDYLLAADLASAGNVNVWSCTSGIGTLAAGAIAHIEVRTHAQYALRVMAKTTGSDTTTLSLRGYVGRD